MSSVFHNKSHYKVKIVVAFYFQLRFILAEVQYISYHQSLVARRSYAVFSRCSIQGVPLLLSHSHFTICKSVRFTPVVCGRTFLVFVATHYAEDFDAVYYISQSFIIFEKENNIVIKNDDVLLIFA
mgnify:CR=1 FL=1